MKKPAKKNEETIPAEPLDNPSPEIRKISFTALIKQHPGMDAGYIEFPFNTKAMFGISGQVKVSVLFDQKVSYRGSLIKMKSECHLLGVTKEVRQKLCKTFGDTVEVELEQDLKAREVALPADVENILVQHPVARAAYEKLSYTNRKELMVWIESSKKEETRIRRLGVLLEKLTKQGKKS